MNRTRRISVGVSLALSLSSAGTESRAEAPPPPAAGALSGSGGAVAGMLGAPGGPGPILVLMNPAVQEELKLNERQKTQVFELARDASRRSRELMQSAFQGGGNNPQAMMTIGARLRQETQRAAGQILQPEQKERVSQIMLQVEGPLSVARPEVAGKLGLSPNQNQQVQLTMMQMLMAAREQMQAGLDGGAVSEFGPGGRDPMARSGMDRLRDAAGQQIGRILNAKQKAAFKKMNGEPFDLSKIDPSLGRPSSPTSTSGDASSADPEKPRARRKRSGTPKRRPAKDAGDEAKPKP